MRQMVLCLALAFGFGSSLAQNLSPTNALPAPRPRVRPQPFEFKTGERVVFLGDPWMAEEQKESYIETMLTSRQAARKPTFRNLAWCADGNSHGSKGSFDRPQKDLKQLSKQLQAIKPTVAFLAFGTEDAGIGQTGVEKFKRNIEMLMDTITNASKPDPVRFVILTPLYCEAIGSPVPDLAARNAQLELYAKALREIAAERNARLMDLFEEMRKNQTRRGAQNLTSDGLHPTPYGYWQIAGLTEWSLYLFPGVPRMGIGRNNSVRHGGGGVIPENISRTEKTIRLTGKDEFVFRPLEPKHAGTTNAPDGFLVQFYPMPAGKYTLKIDGEVSAVYSGPQWMEAAMVRHGPLFDRAEALRQAIIKKNELCLQWSLPQKRTHLLGSHKNKSGKMTDLASDPLIPAEEEKIFKLTELKARQYELTPAQPGDEERLK